MRRSFPLFKKPGTYISLFNFQLYICVRRDRRRCGRLHCRRRAAARSDADGTDPLRRLVTARARTGLGFASETTRRQKSEHSGVPCRECGLCKHGAREPAWYVLVSYISRRSQSSQHRNRRPVNVFTPHRTRRQKLCLGWFCGAERRQKVVRRDRVRGAGAGCIGGASCDVVFTSGMRARHSQRLANSPKFCIPK